MGDDLVMEDADYHDDDRGDERQQHLEAMELGYGLALPDDNPRDEEAELLVSKFQSLFDHFQVPLGFQLELYSLLRLDDRALVKPITDVALASAVAEIKNHLTFHLSKFFLVFQRVRGPSRAQTFLQSLRLLDPSLPRSGAAPPPPPLHYHVLARAAVAAPCSKLYLKMDPNGGDADRWKKLVGEDFRDEQQRETMIRLLMFDDERSKCQDAAWAGNLAEGLLSLAETAVFRDRAGELGGLMRREAGDAREVGVRHYRDRLAHVFEFSRLPTSEKDFSDAGSNPPARSIVTDTSYLMYKKMIQQAERARDDPRCYRSYRPHQRALYDYCVDRIKQLHAPLLEEFERSRKAAVDSI